MKPQVMIALLLALPGSVAPRASCAQKLPGFGGVARRTERGTETNHVRGVCDPTGETHDGTSYGAFITVISRLAAPLAVVAVALG